MDDGKEYGLLIAAIVAIVSIVGLVILFSKASVSGAATQLNVPPPPAVKVRIEELEGRYKEPVDPKSWEEPINPFEKVPDPAANMPRGSPLRGHAAGTY